MHCSDNDISTKDVSTFKRVMLAARLKRTAQVMRAGQVKRMQTKEPVGWIWG